MTTLGLQDWLLDSALTPSIDGDPIRPLYVAASRGMLALPFCAACDLPLELEQQVCDGCGHTECQWRAVEPRGRVHAATMMHRREAGLVRAAVPYPIVDVDLDSGHRMLMTTLAPVEDLPNIGAEVHIAFRRLGDVAIPAIDNLEDHE